MLLQRNQFFLFHIRLTIKKPFIKIIPQKTPIYDAFLP